MIARASSFGALDSWRLAAAPFGRVCTGVNMHTTEDGTAGSSVPAWAVRPARQCLDKLDDETRFLHLTIRGLRHLQTVPRLLEALRMLGNEIANERAAGPCSPQVSGPAEDAAWVERELQADFPLLHSHAVVALWSALEVLCEDLAVAWLQNRPDAWKAPEIAKLRIALGEYEALSAPERSRYVVHELGRARQSAFKTGVGAFDPVLQPFALAPPVGAGLRRALHELHQVRNVVVHCGGRADQRLATECPWLALRLGDAVNVTHRLYGWYHGAAYRYAERIFNQVLIHFTGSGCTCPGMDDWQPRPLMTFARTIGAHAVSRGVTASFRRGGPSLSAEGVTL